MHYYQIAGLTLRSFRALGSFEAFRCGEAPADVILEPTDREPGDGAELASGTLLHRRLADGWFFRAEHTEHEGLYASPDYTRLRLLGGDTAAAEWLVRVALECALARRGCVSLHSAAVRIDGAAVAFTGPSGMGKSTRAAACAQGLGAVLISGDRPLIRVRDRMLFGVPWDGKEQCFRNVSLPLRAVCEVRRSPANYVRALTPAQRRRLLLRQCFMPMWDTDTAAVQMANIARLSAWDGVVRAFCGPTDRDMRALYPQLLRKDFRREEHDMKAKPGFVLKNVSDEHLLMPAGDNINRFNGVILLNGSAALVWEKLQAPVSRDDLLNAILEAYDVDRDTAAADLDALLRRLKEYGAIEEE